MEYRLTNRQARQFMLLKQGLLGEYRFAGKEGALAYVRQAGSIQFDPIDVCGQNSQLVLQARVRGFRKKHLDQLLYTDRKLIDYFDKCLCIMPVEDWKYFGRQRNYYREHSRSKELIGEVQQQIREILKERGYVSSRDLDLNEKVDWYWGPSKLSRAALESLYYQGDLVIHHKAGTQKYYSLAEDYLPDEIRCTSEPFEEDMDHFKWLVLRRVGALGMLWSKASDAWLGLNGFYASKRVRAFKELYEEGCLSRLLVEGIKEPLYALTKDCTLVEEVLSGGKWRERTEFLGPLDGFLWDRKLIEALFGFSYKWEIYTPAAQRKYGHYVLPILSGETFTGRIEMVHVKDAHVLEVRNIWLEPGMRHTQKLAGRINTALRRFARFHECEEILGADEAWAVIK